MGIRGDHKFTTRAGRKSSDKFIEGFAKYQASLPPCKHAISIPYCDHRTTSGLCRKNVCDFEIKK